MGLVSINILLHKIQFFLVSLKYLNHLLVLKYFTLVDLTIFRALLSLQWVL